MAWTLSDYQNKVGILCPDQEPQADDITGFVNECLQQKLQPYAHLQASDTVPLVKGQSQYSLPPDWYEPVYIYRQDDSNSDPTELPKRANHDRTSRGYRLWGGKMVIQPIPGDADAGKTLYRDYYRTVKALSKPGDVPEIEPEFHDIPFLFAVARVKKQDDEPAQEGSAWAEYQMRLAEYIRKQNSDGQSGFQQKPNF